MFLKISKALINLTKWRKASGACMNCNSYYFLVNLASVNNEDASMTYSLIAFYILQMFSAKFGQLQASYETYILQ